MRNRSLYLITLLLLLINVSCIESNDLEADFISPPDNIQTSVYWYWISDNISEEGAVRDLHAMKEAGINRAFIGNIGIEDLPYGDVKILSDEWWDIMHTALRTATELDIEIGIFNSPGWSQSGGPWIKPEESMRYLASSQEKIVGPGITEIELSEPTTFFQDVRVIALPNLVGDGMIMNSENSMILTIPTVLDINSVFDGDISTGVNFPEGGKLEINFKTDEPFTARSLTVHLKEVAVYAHTILEFKGDNDEFKVVKEFGINRSNPALNVGFVPFAPVTISFDDVTASEFRLTFNNVPQDAGLAEIVLSSLPKVERYSEKTLAKMHPTPLPYWDAYMWEEQKEPMLEGFIINDNDVIDVTEYMSEDGVLRWDAPEGEWIILRLGMAPTEVTNGPASPEATGLEVDKMSKEWVAEHFDRFIGEILRRIPEEDRKTFKVVVQDSYETGGQNFTDGFLEEFKSRYGYSAVPYLPVFNGFVINSQLESDRFLWDIRRMIADKVAYDYVGGLRDVSHENGLTTWLENYGHWGFPGEFLMYGGQSDEIGGEYWSEGELGNIENRAATSAGHIYGKNKISAESNTSGGPAYSRYPAMMKQRTDRFFAEGINNTLLHVYIMQPYEDKNPGVNAWFGNEFDRKNTWFSQIDLFTAYLKRSNMMLQQGLNVADVAYFIGEDAPKMTGVTDPPLPVGYQFDYINAEVIVRDMRVEDGLLTLPHGTKYKVLVLPKQKTMRPEVLVKIKELADAGAVVVGQPPTHSPSLENQPFADERVREMASEIWGEVDGVNIKHRVYGKGYIMNGLPMKEVFELIDLPPDCLLPEDNSIHYGHRTVSDNTDIYFISNQANEEKIIYPEFRVTGRQPELWDAVTGSIRLLPAYDMNEGSTMVPIKLSAYESVFIVFKKRAEDSSLKEITDNYPLPEVIVDLEGPWMENFETSRRGPAEEIEFESLYDWTTSLDERIKYYSGEATYKIDFELPEKKDGENYVIDLGNLTAMAKVYVNDTYAGGAWTSPYNVDITDFINSGANSISVTVVNNWMNRIIGDMGLPEEQRKTWYLVNPYHAESRLQPSGLFGPVAIKAVRY